MAPARIEEPPVSWDVDVDAPLEPYTGPPRNLKPINAIHFDSSLQPKDYTIAGTHPDSKVLFLDVNILDSTGANPYHGDVYIEGSSHQVTRRFEWSNVDQGNVS